MESTSSFLGDSSYSSQLELIQQDELMLVDCVLTRDGFHILPPNSRASSNVPPKPLLMITLTSISTVRSNAASMVNSFMIQLNSGQMCHLQAPSKKDLNRWLFEFQRSLSHLLKKRLSDIKSTTTSSTSTRFRRSPPASPSPMVSAANNAPISQSLQPESGFAVFRQQRSPAKSIDGFSPVSKTSSSPLGSAAKFSISPSASLSHGHGRHFRGRRKSGSGLNQTPTRVQTSTSIPSVLAAAFMPSSPRGAESPPPVERSTTSARYPSSSPAIDADSSPSNAIFEMSMDELDMDFLPKPILQTSLSNPSTPSAPSTYTMSAHQNNETLLQFNNLAMQPRSSTPSPLLPPSPPPPPNIGSTSNQGVRSSQEDRYAVHNFTTSSGVEMTLCGIFDGHCGDQASEFCALNLLRVFTSCLSLQSTVINAVKSTFTQLDHEFCTLAKENVWESGTTAIIVVLHGDKLTCGNVGDCRAVVGRVYDPSSSSSRGDGWTNITVKTPTPPPTQPSSFNAAPLHPTTYSFMDVAPIHKASQPEEEKRIVNSNGWITRERDISIGHLNRLDLNDPDVVHIIERNLAEQEGGNSNNPGRLVEIDRVCGELAVSRSLGDLDFKGAYQDKDSEGWWVGPNFLPYTEGHSGKFRGDLVTSEADVMESTIQKGDYVVLCCDGITDVMELEDVARIASNLRYQQFVNAQGVSQRLVELALQLGSSDNCTITCLTI